MYELYCDVHRITGAATVTHHEQSMTRAERICYASAHLLDQFCILTKEFLFNDRAFTAFAKETLPELFRR
jgi:hypothetical protein